MGARHLPANRIALSGGYRPGHWNPRYDQAHYICGGREEKYAPAALRKPHVYAERPESGGQQRSCVVSAKGGQPEYRQHHLLVPASSLGKLAHMCEDTDEFRVGTTGDHIVFFRDGLLFSARLMSGRYINTEQLISSLVNTFTVLPM